MSGNWAFSQSKKFLYNGWDMVAELDGANTVVRSYGWLGKSGGLLWVKDSGGEFYVPSFDGNRNVTKLIKWSDRSVAAEYEYAPFGTLVRATGPMAGANPFRFSSEYHDNGTGLVYYGYRYYSPETHRWLSKDPIGYAGGLNLYGFVGNDPVNGRDLFGLQSAFCKIFATKAALDNGIRTADSDLYRTAGAAKPAGDVAMGAMRAYGGALEASTGHPLLVANGLDNINAGFGQISSFEYQPAYLESGIYWAAGDGPMGQSIYIGTQLGIGFIPGRPLWPNQPNRTPIPEPDIPPGSAPITLPKNLPKNFPGQLPNGSKLSEFGENYFVLEYPDGTKTIRFKACEAKQVRQPVKGEPSGTPETLASLNSEGDVVVQEGLHRLNAVAVDGASVADSVQGATGWLEYNYGGKVDLIGEGIGWGPPLNKPNPVPNLPWHGEGYDW